MASDMDLVRGLLCAIEGVDSDGVAVLGPTRGSGDDAIWTSRVVRLDYSGKPDGEGLSVVVKRVARHGRYAGLPDGALIAPTQAECQRALLVEAQRVATLRRKTLDAALAAASAVPAASEAAQ